MEVGECTPKDMSACSCRDDSMMGQRKENNGEGRRSALAYMRPCHSTCVEMMCSLVHSFLLQVPFAGQNQDPYHGKCDYHVGEFDPAFDKWCVDRIRRDGFKGSPRSHRRLWVWRRQALPWLEAGPELQVACVDCALSCCFGKSCHSKVEVDYSKIHVNVRRKTQQRCKDHSCAEGLRTVSMWPWLNLHADEITSAVEANFDTSSLLVWGWGDASCLHWLL